MNHTLHEQLSDGAAFVENDADTPTVRIVPIAEGEQTVGQSGEETVWTRGPLEEAVEQGAFDGATIVRGTSGKNPHHSMDAQVAPEDLLGRVDEWSYEPGVGPVGEAPLADKGIANRINLGLLEVSPDLYRRLGDYDEELGGRPVENIIDVPRLTLLENGAGANASIEVTSETAEALAYNPDADEDHSPGGELSEEQLAQANELAYSVLTGTDPHKAEKEQLSPREAVKRFKGADPAEHDTEAQLAAAVERSDDDTSGGSSAGTANAGGTAGAQSLSDAELGEEQLAEANDLAYEVMSASAVQKGAKEQLSPRQAVKRTTGVDPAEYGSEEALRAALDERREA